MKRAMERERRKARTAQLREGYNNGTLSAEELAIVETRKAKESLRRSTKKRFNTSGDIDLRDHGDGENGTNSPRRKKGPRAPWEGVVLIDMGFDDLMLDNVSCDIQGGIIIVADKPIGDQVDGVSDQLLLFVEPADQDTRPKRHSHFGITRELTSIVAASSEGAV
jgi:hypothetical protein